MDAGTGVTNWDNNQMTIFKENCLFSEGGTAENGNQAGYTPGHTGRVSWQIHYDYVDLDVTAGDGDVYYSPSDVAGKLTEQLRAPKNLYNNLGGGNRLATGTFPNTAGKYPVNAMFRPIQGPCANTPASAGVPANRIDEGAGGLNGQYPEHSFCFFKEMDERFIDNSR